MTMRTFIAFFLLLITFPALAQDPPGRVGRLSYIDGQVSAKTPDQADWQQATLNYPVSTGQSFLTDQGARAEIQVGAAELRLDQDSQLDVTRLDDSVAQFALPQGTANIHVHTVPQGGLTIRTPKGDVALTKAGSYRIGSDPDQGRVDLAVLEGQASFKGPRGSLNVDAGESALIAGDPINVTFDQAEATDFDNWALSREQREPTAASLQYVSPQTTGYQDLDRNGAWQSEPNYGPVWYPTTVTPDWAPYRYGHWAYVRPWGWTWIDDAPWGFAPFHYGRWVQVGPRWGWWPGTIVERPVYAPALVAFVGGNGFDISISIGGSRPAVGWIPLAPHEVFRPAYRVSPTYVRNVNVTTVNKTVINNITVNKNVTVEKFANHEAVTTVSRDDFARGAKVQQAKVEVAHDKIAATRVNANADIQKIQPQHVEAKAAPPQHIQPKTLQAQPQSRVAARHDQPQQRQVQQPQAEHRQTQPQAGAQAETQPQPRAQQQKAPQQRAQPQRPQQQARIQQSPRPEQTTQLRPTPEGWHREARQEQPQPQPQHQQTQPQQQQAQPQQRPQSRQQDHGDPRKKKDEN